VILLLGFILHNHQPKYKNFDVLTSLGIRLQEHRMEMDSMTKRAFTRSQCIANLSGFNRSTLTDEAIQQNHVIDWPKATVSTRNRRKKSESVS